MPKTYRISKGQVHKRAGRDQVGFSWDRGYPFGGCSFRLKVNFALAELLSEWYPDTVWTRSAALP